MKILNYFLQTKAYLGRFPTMNSG